MHGIPISIKDIIDQKGFLSTIGCAYLCQEKYRSKDHAAIVKLYLKHGAIPIVRGNCPQSALSIHTDNLIFGESKNPHKNERSCGGSSGGDAGLIASKCIPFAIGTDIGGSLRYPAAFCGIYGFKPTTSRISSLGLSKCRSNKFSAFNHLSGVIGPMGKSVDDLIVGMKVQLDGEIHKFDPLTAPSPFKQHEFDQVSTDPKKIKIGILNESSLIPVSQSVKRAMVIAEKALGDLGYQIVQFNIDEDFWTRGREFFMGMAANGNSPPMIDDFKTECETMLKPLERTLIIL